MISLALAALCKVKCMHQTPYGTESVYTRTHKFNYDYIPVPMLRMDISPKYDPALNVASTILPPSATTCNLPVHWFSKKKEE